MSHAHLAADLAAKAVAELEFEFTLQVELAEHDPVMESLMQRLDDAGCFDTLVGAGATCSVELQFITPARTAQEALNGAAAQVQRAFQGAKVTRIVPAPDTPSTGSA
ncbi:hypothetical protein PV762_27250 [Mitsuaria sp. CC2]|uniref:hypothetical protein n=1 Tax=Mitsuaria sp. CC2 TaxID=3029186 RepID=UPI003B8E84BE